MDYGKGLMCAWWCIGLCIGVGWLLVIVLPLGSFHLLSLHVMQSYIWFMSCRILFHLISFFFISSRFIAFYQPSDSLYKSPVHMALLRKKHEMNRQRLGTNGNRTGTEWEPTQIKTCVGHELEWKEIEKNWTAVMGHPGLQLYLLLLKWR